MATRNRKPKTESAEPKERKTRERSPFVKAAYAVAALAKKKFALEARIEKGCQATDALKAQLRDLETEGEAALKLLNSGARG